MISIEVNGVPCVFNDAALNDFDMLELLEKFESGNRIALVGLARGFFGDEQLENIKSQIRNDDGVCEITAIEEFVSESLHQAAIAKKADVKN